MLTVDRQITREIADCGGPSEIAPQFNGMWTNEAKKASTKLRFHNAKELELKLGSMVDFTLSSQGGYPALIGLRVQAPARWEQSALTIDLIQLDEEGKMAVGGIAIELRAQTGRESRS